MSLPDLDLAAAPSGRRNAPLHLVETARFGANPGDLRMLSFAPGDLAPKSPLVVTLHGCGQSAEAYAAGAGWLQLAQTYGFVVLSPEQGAGNNPNRCFNWFNPQDAGRGQGEAASIRQMVATAIAAHDCDPKRVFVTGLSAGGAMTTALLADYPEVFAAGGVIAGLPYRAADNMMEALGAMFQGRSRPPAEWGDLVRGAHDHPGPWPRISIWQGDADATVKPSNADALAQQWGDVHGLPAGPTRTTINRNHRRDVWMSAAGDPVLELNSLKGLAHGTPLATLGPDGHGAAGPFLIETGVSSSLELLRFWGLAPPLAAVAAPAKPVVAEPPQLRAAALAARAAARRPMIDLQGAVTKALRGAGLIR